MDNVQNLEQEENTEIETEEVEESKPTLRDVVTQAYEEQIDKDLDGLLGDKTKEEVSPQPLPNVQEAKIPEAQVPTSWNKEDRADFLTLKPEVQKRILDKELKRDKIFNQFLEKQAAFNKSYPGLDEVVAPYKDTWGRAGVTPTQVFSQFLSWQNYLDKDPKAALRELISSYQLKPEDLAQDATERPIDNRYHALEKKISELETSAKNQQSSWSNAQVSQIDAAIGAFASQKDAQGAAMRPHFDRLYTEGRVAPIVQRLMTANPQMQFHDVLQTAYEEAAWAHPEIRQALMSAQSESRQQEERMKVQKAKQAASSIRGGPGISAATKQSKPLRDVLSDKYDELMNGV